jgi:hypothetical protein
LDVERWADDARHRSPEYRRPMPGTIGFDAIERLDAIEWL